MKKNFVIIMFVFIGLALSSCKKDEHTAPFRVLEMSGTITDVNTGVALVGIRIEGQFPTEQRPSLSTTTDAEGKYTLTSEMNMELGDFIFYVNAIDLSFKYGLQNKPVAVKISDFVKTDKKEKKCEYYNGTASKTCDFKLFRMP